MTDTEQSATWCLAMQNGDSSAFEAIVRHYTSYVMTIIRQVTVPPLCEADVEELTTDTFVRLWKHAKTVRDPSALKSYLAQIARRAAVDRLRQRKETIPLEEDTLISTERTPETMSSLREQMQIIAEALDVMEPMRRSCMIRRYYYGEPLHSIAKRLSLPLSTVKSHIYRGRKQLIAALKEGGYSYEDDKFSGIV